MTKPLLPSPSDIVGAGGVELVRFRPKAFPFVNYGKGVYSLFLAGMRAQATIIIADLAGKVVATNMALTPDPLARAASEFDTPSNAGAIKATGDLVLKRTVSTTGGAIKQGTRLNRLAEPTAAIAVTAADYITTADIPVLVGQTTVTVPIQAVRDGASSNTPVLATSPYKQLVVTDTLFDKSLKPFSYDVGGGSDGLTPAAIRRFALAYAAGHSGPNDAALEVATLDAPGVGHFLIQDPSANGMTIYVADAAWGGSARWASAVQQSISESDYLGHGCKFKVSLIDNTIVNCTLTVRLRDSSFLSNTAELDGIIRAAVRSYFDDRHDFNVVGTQQLRSVVSRADKRILRCTSAAINHLDGTPYVGTSPFYGHLYLADNAVAISYQGPV